MSTFPFLKLPLLAQKVAFGQLDLFYVIELSMMSKKIENVLKHVKISVKKFEYRFEIHYCSLFIYTSSGKFSFTPISSSGCNLIGTRRFDLQVFHKAHRSTFLRVKCEEDNNRSKLECLEKLTKYLLNFLKVKNFELSIRKYTDILNLFVWKYTKRFNNFRCHPYEDESIFLTSIELKFLLGDLTIDSLLLDIKIKNDPAFKYHPQNKGSSNIRNLYIVNSNWVDYNNVLNIANDSIRCYIPTGFSEKLNGILKKWMLGANESLEEMEFRVEGGGEFMEEQVLEGINATLTAFTIEELEKQTKLDKSKLFQLYLAIDIRREHDGCQATVLFWYRQLRMIVWNKKHLKAIGRL